MKKINYVAPLALLFSSLIVSCDKYDADTPVPEKHREIAETSHQEGLPDEVEAVEPNISKSIATNKENSPYNVRESNVGWYKPVKSVTWQWQLKDKINTEYRVDLYDIDLFDSSESLIKDIQSSGGKVICYFSAGSFEDWRDDKDLFDKKEIGHMLDDWPGESWLDIRSSNVRDIMMKRLDIAKKKGCDGVEPDNVDGYTNDPGFDLTGQDQIKFNLFLAEEAHKRNLSIGLKNDLDQIDVLQPYFDFAVNEQCFEYSECEVLMPFIANGKPVLNAEYKKKYRKKASIQKKLCAKSKRMGFSTLILPMDLDDKFRISCL